MNLYTTEKNEYADTPTFTKLNISAGTHLLLNSCLIAESNGIQSKKTSFKWKINSDYFRCLEISIKQRRSRWIFVYANIRPDLRRPIRILPCQFALFWIFRASLELWIWNSPTHQGERPKNNKKTKKKLASFGIRSSCVT